MGQKQHYVPRILLKGFASTENGKQINIYILEKDKIIYNGGLYEQAQKHNLYGADQKLELVFSRLESEFSKVIIKLKDENLNLTLEEQSFLKIFILIQRLRTPSAVKLYNDSINQMGKNILLHDRKVEGIIDKFDLELSDPYLFLFKMAAKTVKNISDLRVGLIKPPENKKFIIGEHPVVILNPFLEYRNWIGSKQGLGVKGTIIILPICKDISIVLYDGVRYKFSNFRKIITISNSDIDKLNYCQVLQTDSCVYFSEVINVNELLIYRDKSVDYRNETKSKIEVFKGPESKKSRKKSELVMIGSVELPIKQEFSFISMIQSQMNVSLGPSMDIRREALKLYEEFHSEV